MPEEVIDDVVLEPVEGQEEQPQAQPPAEGEQPPKTSEAEKPKGPIQLVDGTKLNAAVRTALEPVCAAIDAAKVDGFVVIFGLGANADGKQVVVQCDIAKHYSA